MIPMCYPSDSPSGEFISNWSLWYILELDDYYKRTDDFGLLARSEKKVCGILEYFLGYVNQEGFLESLSHWVFVEWSRANDFTYGVNMPSNMLYSAALIAAGRCYKRSGWTEQGKALRGKIADYAFNGSFFEDNLIRKDGRLVRLGNITETCQYYAFYFGVADKAHYPSLYDTLFSESFGIGRDESSVFPHVFKSNAFIGNFLRLDYLCSEKRFAQVNSESKASFLHMAHRTGTLWEHNNPTNSLNHGFASYVAVLIMRAAAGLKDKL